MEHSLLWNNKELFPGSGLLSRRAFIAISTKGSLCPFFGKDCFECLSPRMQGRAVRVANDQPHEIMN